VDLDGTGAFDDDDIDGLGRAAKGGFKSFGALKAAAASAREWVSISSGKI
jgi:hypothetical protein